MTSKDVIQSIHFFQCSRKCTNSKEGGHLQRWNIFINPMWGYGEGKISNF